jgi:hypothetical protein
MGAAMNPPHVYGEPRHVAVLFASVAAVVEREPDATFEDQEVRRAGRLLAELIERRCRPT